MAAETVSASWLRGALSPPVQWHGAAVGDVWVDLVDDEEQLGDKLWLEEAHAHQLVSPGRGLGMRRGRIMAGGRGSGKHIFLFSQRFGSDSLAKCLQLLHDALEMCPFFLFLWAAAG